ncbi:hypothetical protein HDU97_007799 [Phlyctochytrium planicorne]|nr:hypothetical protein HDU97_007799 [Phlyctochytrium planicorne]
MSGPLETEGGEKRQLETEDKAESIKKKAKLDNAPVTSPTTDSPPAETTSSEGASMQASAKADKPKSSAKTPTASKSKSYKRKKADLDSDDDDEPKRPAPRRASSGGSKSAPSKTTGAGRLAKAGQAVGTAQRKSVFLDKEHVVEKGLVEWFKPLLTRMLRMWIQKHCADHDMTFSEAMLAEVAYQSLNRQKYPLKFVSETTAKYEDSGISADTLIRSLAYLILAKCLPFTSTYFTFHSENDPETPADETPGVNCERGWKPLHRPVRSFVLDVFPFAAKGTGEPTISTMCNEVDYWKMEDPDDQEAWEVCCQLQVCNVAFVTTLGLQMAFTDDYPKEARVSAIIHAVRSNRLIRDKEKLRNVKHMHVAKRLIMDRVVSEDWLKNPHLPKSIQDKLADPTALCKEKPAKGKEATEEADIKAAVADLKVSHRDFFGTAQKSFSSFDWKPRTKGDTLKDLGSSDDDKRGRGKRTKGSKSKGDDDGDDLSIDGSQSEDSDANDVAEEEGEDALPSWVLKSLKKQSKKVVYKRKIDLDAIVADWDREDEEEEANKRLLLEPVPDKPVPPEVKEMARAINAIVSLD